MISDAQEQPFLIPLARSSLITHHPSLPVRGAHDADRTRDLVLTKDVLYQLSYVGLLTCLALPSPPEKCFESSWISATIHALRPTLHILFWSGRWELNPRQPAWKAGTLPLSYARLCTSQTRSLSNSPNPAHNTRSTSSLLLHRPTRGQTC